LARKRGKSKAQKEKAQKAASEKSVVDLGKPDKGTPETRRRCTPDPLLSTDVEVHRASAGIGIRMAIEEGLDPSGLDMIQIGMGGGSSGYNPFGWTPKERLMEARYVLARWRDACRLQGLRTDLAEAWACGSSVRQLAATTGMHRPKVAVSVNAALDLYADMRGYRRTGPVRQHIAVWETPDAAGIRAAEGLRAGLKKRTIRGNA